VHKDTKDTFQGSNLPKGWLYTEKKITKNIMEKGKGKINICL